MIQSKENEVFYGYLNFIKDKRTERAPSTPCCAIHPPQKTPSPKPKRASPSLQTRSTNTSYYLTNDPRNFLFGKYLKMINEPQVPDAPENVEDAAMWQYLCTAAITGTVWILTTRGWSETGL